MPTPISRHLLPILRLIAILSPFSPHTGIVRLHSTFLFDRLVTVPIVFAVPRLRSSLSPFAIDDTWDWSLLPTTLSKSLMSKLMSVRTGGRVPGFPMRLPTRPSDLVREGSSLLPTPTRPPGRAVLTLPPPVCRLVTSV